MHIEHLCIESRHVHETFRRMQGRNDFRERLNRIAQDAAVETRVQVPLRTRYVQIEQRQPPQTTREHDLVRRGQCGIGKVNEIRRLQPVFVALQKFRETRTPHLFFAFDQKRDPQRKLRIGLQ